MEHNVRIRKIGMMLYLTNSCTHRRVAFNTLRSVSSVNYLMELDLFTLDIKSLAMELINCIALLGTPSPTSF